MKVSRGGLVGAAVLLVAQLLSSTAVEAKRIVRQAPEQKVARAADAETYRAGILIDADTGTVLFEKNAHLKAPPASMTKMMLILLVAERVRDGSMHWDDPITTSAWASKIGGSQVYLKQGEVFPLSEMMQAIVIHSANDASMAVAEAVAGSSEAFVDLMNERAKQLGMKDTTYHSVHGLPPGKGQQADMSSAADLATLARELVKFPEVMKWAGTKEAPFRQGAMTLTNTNRLVRETSWVDGLKTGYYREAGFNVTATGQREVLLPSLPSGTAARQGEAATFAFSPDETYRAARARVETEFERRYVAWLLARHDGNLSAAARAAQMDRKHLHVLARKHGLRGGDPDPD